jgi:radical SAM superfamily enzyme YgiQ (UPF0313 family)
VKKVLLVNPNTETAPYPVAPIGLCLLAASLEGRHAVRVFDATFGGPGDLRRVIGEFRPDFVGIGIRNIDNVTLGGVRYYIDDIKRDYVDRIRTESRAPIILGGSGYNLFPEQLLSHLGADFGVVGEGELSFGLLVDALEAGTDPAGIPGVVIAGVPAERAVRPARSKGPLEIPFSTIDAFVPFEPYRARGTYPIQTKRGCHLKCVYCAYPVIEGRAYRLRSPSSIVDEMEAAAARLGQVVFEIVDSTLNAPAAHAEAICEEIIGRGLRVRLRSMGVNPGAMTERLLELMKAAGFVQIVCSADTASPSMLRHLRKGFERETLESVAGMIRRLDMPTMWSFIFGGPGETAETIGESLDFIDRFIYELDMVHMTEGIRIYPRTPIHTLAVEEGIIAETDDLLRPVFYVSPKLGQTRLGELVRRASETRPNCVRNIDSSPTPDLLRRAAALRREHHLDEPMFRTLLRLRRHPLA